MGRTLPASYTERVGLLVEAGFRQSLVAIAGIATAPECCPVVEDSPAGIDAAVAAGMTAIGFCGGSHCGPEHGARLQARGAALVIAEMSELANAIAKLG